jgi:hypothetical protein
VLDCIFIGPDKSGSTWLYERLREHPGVALPRSKELFYFDRYHHLGPLWLDRQFAAALPGQLRMELSHDYLFSEPAIARIAAEAPGARLVVSLREPIDRAVSAYHYLRLQGRIRGSVRLDEALMRVPELIDHGRYGTHLDTVLRHIPREQLIVLLYDDLKADPQLYFDRLCNELGISTIELTPDQRAPVLQAPHSRFPMLTRALRAGGERLRRGGHHGAVAKAKEVALRSPALFSGATSRGREAPSDAVVLSLKGVLASEVNRAAGLTGLPLAGLWGYTSVAR